MAVGILCGHGFCSCVAQQLSFLLRKIDQNDLLARLPFGNQFAGQVAKVAAKHGAVDNTGTEIRSMRVWMQAILDVQLQIFVVAADLLPGAPDWCEQATVLFMDAFILLANAILKFGLVLL